MVSTPTLAPYIPESMYGSKGDKESRSDHDFGLQIGSSNFSFESLIARSLHVKDTAFTVKRITQIKIRAIAVQ